MGTLSAEKKKEETLQCGVAEWEKMHIVYRLRLAACLLPRFVRSTGPRSQHGVKIH